MHRVHSYKNTLKKILNKCVEYTTTNHIFQEILNMCVHNKATKRYTSRNLE